MIPQIHRLIQDSFSKSAGVATFLITSKASDARRRGATTEAYALVRRKPAPAKAGGGASEGNAADDALLVIKGFTARLTHIQGE
jgi:hypothetical protein